MQSSPARDDAPPPSAVPAAVPAGTARTADSQAAFAATLDPGVDPAATPADGVGATVAQTFSLHSNPGSTYKIYLDFDGHTTTGTAWNNYDDSVSFYSPAFSVDGSGSFSVLEITEIQQIWQMVAEYFSPFNIDVTTEDPGVVGLSRSSETDQTFGIRVVVNDEARGRGGVAQLGSFDWASDTPVFVYANALGDAARAIADAAGHEVGHSLGLDHDGQATSPYYLGHGSGATSWAPIMGTSYYSSVGQWSKGDYAGATNSQDDLAIITSQNSGVALRADDYGDGFATAAVLAATTSGGVATVGTYGVISGSGAANDVDMFTFQLAAGGGLNLTIGAWTRVFTSGDAGIRYDPSPVGMLDVKATLYDADQKVVFTADDPTRLDAVIALSNLPGGTYYLAIDGTGWGDPFNAAAPTGWTEYGSLGQYMITGTYGTAPPQPPAAPGYLAVDRPAVQTCEAGGAASFTVRAVNATGSVAVQIGGLDTTEDGVSQSVVALDAANNWTATVTLTGVNDLALDGNVGYTLGLSATGLTGATLGVTNLDNDHAAADAGARAGGAYKKQPGAANANLAALAADDGNAMTLSEGTIGATYRLEWRWEVKGLEAGSQVVHLDASSAGEAFRFEYSTSGGATWQGFAGRTAAAKLWSGDFAVTTAAPGSLWLRVVDGAQSGDTHRDSVSVDWLMVETAHTTAAAASQADWVV